MVLKNYLWDDIEPDGASYYDRYWHGYMLYLKPLLMLLDYADIRILNMIIQIFLLLFLITELVKRKLLGAIPAVGMFLVIQNPAATAMSLQFSSIYYIVMLSLLVLIRWGDRLFKRNGIYFFFLTAGICVAYFDFLTYPMTALVIPVAFGLWMDGGSWKVQLRKVFLWSCCWGIGYLGMWGGKWIVGSAVLGINILAEALGQAAVHSGEAVSMEGEAMNALEVLWKNVKVILKWPYFLIGIAMIGYYGKKIFPGFRLKNIWICFPFVLLCAIPCIWIMMLKSHSLWCYWYTYRNLGGTAFAGCMMLELFYMSVKRGNQNKGEDK